MVKQMIFVFSFFLLIRAEETETSSSEPIIGIDLGTTFSCVGVFQNGKVEIIPNEVGNRITPSIVSFTGDQRIVGDAAIPLLINNAENTVFAVKRLIGRRFSDPEVQSEIGRLPYNIVEKDNRPFIELEFKGQKQLVSPEEISALVLAKMKSIAETYLGKKVSSAVVTVPAYFNDGQRRATKDAGTIAGLKVHRILNEPTAAAIAYGLDKKERQKILVYDLGGGTFDVSLLSIEESFFEVLATSGDTHLGGEDFDNRVVDHFIDVYKRKTGKDPSKDSKSIAKLKMECEKAKRALSTLHQTRIEIDDFFEGEPLSETLTRARFEELNLDLFRKTMKPIQQVLKDAQVSKYDVDEVVLVGGSTRLPKIQQMVKDFFNGKNPCKSINPDEAVAYGATVEAAILANDDSVSNILLININPMTLGIETIGGIMSELIPRNTRIPVKKTRVFTTAEDDDDTVTIQIFEGERPMTRDNHFLGSFDLIGLPSGPRGTVNFNVTFELDQNNLLTVTADEYSSGAKESITINAAESRLSEEQLDEAFRSASEWSSEDERTKEAVNRKNQIDEIITYCLNELASDNIEDRFNSEERTRLAQILDEANEWSKLHPAEELEVYDEKLLELNESLGQMFRRTKSPVSVDDDNL